MAESAAARRFVLGDERAPCPSRRIGHLLFCVAHRRRPTHAATAMLVVLLLLATTTDATDAKKRRRMVTLDPSEDVDYPNRPPTKKEAADSGASVEAAAKMPWLPTHTTTCSNHECRPGEGNLKGYKMWGQPYIHREPWVQSKARRPPHKPDPLTQYAALVAAARKIQHKNVVIMAAADWDFRLIISDWHHHLRLHGYHNNLVLSMDTDLHSFLSRQRIPSVDNSENVNDWNTTCLQRHMQRVRMERQLAIAALIASGLDVLNTDATVVFTKPGLFDLFNQAPLNQADLIVQREGGPGGAVKRIGTAVNAGFTYVRCRNNEGVQKFLANVVTRGLVEFYNRWNNVVDQMGWSFLVADTATSLQKSPTSQLANESTIATLGRYGLTLAFLPYNEFPRIGGWDGLQSTARIYHLTADGSLGKQYDQPYGVVPFRGHRQRLDRYDEEDFDSHEKVMRTIGLWAPR